MVGIYKITNLVNGKIYIGQSVNILRRWGAHKSEALSGRSEAPIHRAIRKYGYENFSFEIIEECKQEQLNSRERFWIAHYNSTIKGNGYNLTYGGDCDNSLMNYKRIYELWDEGNTIKEITDIIAQEEGHCCRTTVLNYLSDYENYSVHESRSRAAKKMYKDGKVKSSFPFSIKYSTINQYDLEGNFIQEWHDVNDITENFNVNKVCIYDCINGKMSQSCGYQWKISDNHNKIEEAWTKSNYPLPVIQLSEDNQILAVFESARDAAESILGDKTKAKGILDTCSGIKGRQTAFGYKWRYGISNWKEILEKRNRQEQAFKKKYTCQYCGKPCSSKNLICYDCSQEKKRKVIWASREELKNKIRTMPFTHIAKEYGVTAPAIRGWCEHYNLPRTKKEIESYSDEEWDKL